MKISTFFGEYRFLSNFYYAEFVWDNIVWPSSEHAYVAAKTYDRKLRLQISKMEGGGKIKQFGKMIDLRHDWESVKLEVMREIVYEKFRQNPNLKQKLLNTNDAILEEGNTWGDTFWGICPPDSDNGENQLGKILMSVRGQLRAEQ